MAGGADVPGGVRPGVRKRLECEGAAALSEDELLALLLRRGRAGSGTLEFARELNRAYPRGGLTRSTVFQLRRRGLGPAKAASIIAAFELARRWVPREEERRPLDDPGRVWGELADLRGLAKEHFVALYLNARHDLLHRETISIGTLTASLVHPREVFAPALERRAAGVVVAHNHPSGSCEPSPEDRETTRRLRDAGALLGIPLLDHVLVTESRYFSFRRHGLLP